MIEDFIDQLIQLDINIELFNQNKLRIREGSIKISSDILKEIESKKKEIVIYLKKNKSIRLFSPIPLVDQSSEYVLSSSQRRLWILSQFSDGNVAYNMPGVYVFEGALDMAGLSHAFSALIERHEILRTVFRDNESGDVCQVILSTEELGFSIAETDLQEVAGQQEQVQELIAKDFRGTFDLALGPLLRAGVYRLEADRWVFTYVMHHIISDGWSMEILIKELLAYYNAYVHGSELVLSALRIQYKDYSAWQQKELNEGVLSRHRSYWLQQLSGTVPVLNLATDRPRPLVKTYNGGQVHVALDELAVSGLRVLVQSAGATDFMGVLAAVNALLYRYSGQDDLIVGSPIAGRNHSDLEDQIGFYVNTLALRSRIGEGESYRSLLEQTREITLGAYEHQVYPFDELVNDLRLPVDRSRNPLFDVMVELQHVESSQETESEVNKIQINSYTHVVSKFDLRFVFYAGTSGLSLLIEYNSDLYDRDTITRMGSHLSLLLSEMVDSPEAPISTLSYLSAAEREQLLSDFNATDAPYPADQTLVSLFKEQVLLRPSAIAVVYQEKALSYAEVDAASNRLAHYLLSAHVIGKDTLIGIRLERSEWMILVILGILKSGGAYVPIDPEYPQDRVDYIVGDSGCVLVIDSEWLSEFLLEGASFSEDEVIVERKASDLAYVIYTSGSTGLPKGVMVEHGGVINRIDWMWRYYGFSSSLVVLQKTSYTFDVSVGEIFMPLCWGAKMILCSGGDVAVPERILRLITEHGVSYVHFVAGMLNSFMSWAFEQEDVALRLSSLTALVTSGEALSLDTVQKWYRKLSVPIYNLYGPTEASIEVTHYEPLAADQLVPIGKPISNIQIYIVERHGDLSPVGVAGEICIAGVGVARGYLNRPELSAEKFVPNPYQRAEEKLQGLNERMYLTGDQGRWLSDGNIEFLGRKDDQVKIRGYRIEPGEIENALQGYPGMVSAVVVARKGTSAEQELIAYVVSGSVLVIQELRAYLGSKLPSYMVPSHYVQLDSLPLNASGKTDRKALPDPEGLGMASGVAYVAPRTEPEEKLAAIWSELLEVPQERIGIDDDFLNLGGHSLKMIRLSSQIYKIFGVKTGLQELFSKTTLCAQAALITAGKKEAFSDIPLVDLSSDYVLSSSQRRLWILSQFGDGNMAYNIPGVHLFEGTLDLGGLSHAFTALIERHEILRTVFRNNESGDIRQVVLSASESGFKISEHDLTEASDQQDRVHELIAKDFRETFNLALGPLLRAGVYRLGADRWVFTYVMHHIISDGWSMEILIKELLAYYNAYVSGSALELSGLRIQYKDYAAWQQNELNGASLSRHRSYWQQQLSGTLPVLELATDRPRPAVKTYNGGQVQVTFDQSVLLGLQSLMQSEGTTLFMGVLAGVNALLYRYSGQDDLIVGSPIAGRNHSDLEDQIGFYINTLVLRSRIGEGESYRSLLEQTREVTLGAYEHQVYPFDELVSDLRLATDQSRNPLFDVLVELQHVSDSGESGNRLGDVQVSGYNSGGMDVMSKFDLRFIFQSGQGEELHLNIEYNRDLYDRETVIRMGGHLNALLSEMIISPDAAFSGLDYLSIAEREQLLYGFNATDVSYPAGQTVVSMFREQVLLDPAAIAVVYRDRELSYAEVDAASDRLAHHLVSSHGIGADVLVGLLVERSDWMIIGLLGILKSGGAYVPIDPAYPKERIRYMVEDAGIGLLLTQTDYMFELDYYQGALFAVDVQLSGLDEVSGELLPCRASDLAYVIYTSGSTGQPKGVMIEHGSLMNYLNWCSGYYFDDGLSGHFGLYTSLSFDLTVTSIFCGLLSGRGLFVYDQDQELGSILSDSFSSSRGIDSIKLTPSHIEVLKHSGLVSGNISCAIVGGEEVSVAHVDVLKGINSDMRIYNEYGPTESTVGCIVRELQNDGSRILIGKPVSNTRIYITDRDGGLTAVGVAGEICISGAGLARGYLNRAELSAEKFVPNPYQLAEEKLQGINERMYLTGDQGRWLSDGNIEFLGRKDDQVKIRGYRIELGEIEGVLQGYPDMVSVVVIARKGVSGVRELTAYVVSGSVLVIQELRAYLGSRLPSYMVPSHYVQLDSLPLNANGKTDRKALPDPEGMGMASGVVYVAPRTEMEEKLAAIWSEVLNIPKERIGIHDSFFDLGGDSIKVLRMLFEVKSQLDLYVEVAIVYNHDTISKIVSYNHDHATLIKQKNNDDRDAESYIIEELGHLKEEFVHLGSNTENVEDIYPMSDIEIGMVFESQINEGLGVYHDQKVFFRSFIDFNIIQFENALQLMVEKHPILRTCFNLDELSKPVQIVFKQIPVDVYYKDISANTREEQEIKIQFFLKSSLDTHFDVTNAPLWNMSAFNLGNNNVLFVLQTHHAILDGWSEMSFVTELNNIYVELGKDAHYKPDKLESSYRDSVIKNEIDNRDPVIRDFWKKELLGFNRLNLFTEQEKFDNWFNVLDKNSFNQLEEAAKKLNTSVKVISLSAFTYLLRALSNDNEITTGLVTNNRPALEDGDKILGCFLNTVPLCLSIEESQTSGAYLQKVASKLNELKNYERLSILQIANLHDQQLTSPNPFFDTLFNYVDFHILDSLDEQLSDKKTENLELPKVSSFIRGNTFFDLDVNKTGGSLLLSFTLRKKTVFGYSAQEIGALYLKILNYLVEFPKATLQDISYLSDRENEQLLKEFNATEAAYPTDTTLVDLFEEQVLRTPDAIAVVFEEKALNYSALNEISNRLAHYLRSTHGIVREELIGIMLDRSEQMIIAILGILKSGAAYVPIDPEYPKERIDYMIRDSKCRVVIDEQYMKEFNLISSSYGKDNLATEKTPEDLAYVIYTSGSTGQPKGVMVEHGGLLNYVYWSLGHYFNETSSGNFGLYTSLSFDLTVTSIFCALLRGKRLFIYNQNEELAEILTDSFQRESHVDSIKLTPSHIQLLKHSGITSSSINCAIVGGEQVTSEHVRILKNINPGMRIYNEYGPTESTVGCIIKELQTDEPVLIGKPIFNTRIYICDSKGRLSPFGIPGEICIAGAGLARGYLNRRELTAEKFVPNPYQTEAEILQGTNERMYLTGDQGRWLADGNIEFLGRKDDQVKIRGHRIELGEIERTILDYPEVDSVVVIARIDISEDNELVAYVVGKVPLLSEDIRSYLENLLPSYMLPGYYVQLESLPLTTNGKINREALPKPDDLGMDHGILYVAPVSPVEHKLTEIWSEILRIPKERIGIYDNFLALGGNSLKAMRAVKLIRDSFKLSLPLKVFFAKNIIHDIAIYIHKTAPENIAHISSDLDDSNELFDISFNQLMYFSNWLKLENHTVVSTYKFSSINLDTLKLAILKLVERHEVLRTEFVMSDGKIYQKIIPLDALNFNIISYDGKKSLKDLNHIVDKRLSETFDLFSSPLFYIEICRMKNGEYYLILTLHHILCDAYSAGIVRKELPILYDAMEGRADLLKELKYQYKNFAHWQNQFVKTIEGEHHKSYWINKLKGFDEKVKFPYSENRKKNSYLSHSIETIEGQFFEDIKNYTQKQNLTYASLLLGTLVLMINKLSGQDDLTILTQSSGRNSRFYNELDVTGLYGNFTNLLMVRNKVSSDISINEFFQNVLNGYLDDLSHDAYPMDKLLKELPAKNTTSFLESTVVFNYHNYDYLNEIVYSKVDKHIKKMSSLDHEISNALVMPVTEMTNSLRLHFVFNRKYFKQSQVKGIKTLYMSILNQVILNPDLLIDDIPYVEASREVNIVL
ncbi:amino acid adenylation domain-containing protein [Pedobacter sp. FW305-3-2-15-E-R2A2]|uniref:amino acid adenylation domain-containing protein n=1 Tax=Pedobacter sp. FW305-3-2-15-E-R2A2 TaxID=3140251 RepID=UPI003140C406